MGMQNLALWRCQYKSCTSSMLTNVHKDTLVASISKRSGFYLPYYSSLTFILKLHFFPSADFGSISYLHTTI
jgi:hypothetical protein